MSVIEGMCHALFAALTVLILGLPLSMVICAEVSKKSFAGAVVPYQFPFLEMGLFLLVLFGMEVILSVWMVSRQKKAIPGRTDAGIRSAISVCPGGFRGISL